jgi:nucleoid DNA-binding protein
MMQNDLLFINFAGMTTIASHITKLIHHHDCVIVPGLGGFVANHKPAEIIREKGLILPPSKEIGFNRSLSHNDGLLIHEVAWSNQLSYSDASKLVESFVQEIHTGIAIRGTITIDEVGELRKDTLGNLYFVPNTSLSFLPEAFGLAPVQVNLPAMLVYPQTKSRIEMPPIMHRLSKTKIAASIALLVGFFLLSTDVNTPGYLSLGSLSPLPQTHLEAAHHQPDGSNCISEVIAVPESDAKTSAPIAIINEPQIVYCLIGASFPEETEANKYQLKMIEKGFPNCEVITGNGRYRISLNQYTSREEAFAALEEYRIKKGFESVWLHKTKR